VLDTEGSNQHVGTSKRRSRIKGYEPSALVRGGVDMKGIFYRRESTLCRAPSDQDEIPIASPRLAIEENGATYSASRCGRRGGMFRLSLADFGAPVTSSSGGTSTSLSRCGARQEFITVPDRANMWWLVPSIGVAT